MIEAHELDEQLQTQDYTSWRIFKDNQDILNWLNLIFQSMENLRRAVGMQSPRPSLITIPSSPLTYASYTRFMCETLTLTVSAACTVSLMTGSVAERTWNFAAADTKVLDYPIELEPGKDYSILVSAGTASAYFTGYPEKEQILVTDEEQGS